MTKKWSALTIAIFAIIGALFLFFRTDTGEPSSLPDAIGSGPVQPETNKIIDIPPSVLATLRDGDVIFRGKDNSWGDLGAKLSDRDQRFGHVGVVVRHDESWMVIDAIGNPLDTDGSVRLRSLEEFLEPATRAALYRPTLPAEAHARYLAYIWKHEAAQTPFDRFYDLGDAAALYCTELIWLAWKTATGEEQVPEQTEFRRRRVIAIDDLQYAPIMSEIWTQDSTAPLSPPAG